MSDIGERAAPLPFCYIDPKRKFELIQRKLEEVLEERAERRVKKEEKKKKL